MSAPSFHFRHLSVFEAMLVAAAMSFAKEIAESPEEKEVLPVIAS